MKPNVLFVSLTNDIGLERLAAAMARHGAVCAALSPPGFFCTKTRFISRHFALPRHFGMWLGMLAVQAKLELATRVWSPDIVVPLDDVAAWLLHRIAVGEGVTVRLQRLLKKSLGSPAGYPVACNRLGLMRLASRLGIRVPDYRGVDTPSAALKAADGMGYPVVLKSEYSCGGHGVLVSSDPEQLARNMKSVMPRELPALSRGRTAAKHFIWRLAGLAGTYGLPPILQAFVPGKPAMYAVAAWEGKVLDGVGFIAERTYLKSTGTSSVVRHVENEEMKATARLLVKELGCSGFVSFDFMLDTVGGHAYLIEMNPRAIGTGHLGRDCGHDLCGALVALLGGKVAAPNRATIPEGHSIALCPKELCRDPENLRWLYADDVIHDVPSDDPTLVTAYLEWLSKTHPTQIEALKRVLGHGPVVGGTLDHGVTPDRHRQIGTIERYV